MGAVGRAEGVHDEHVAHGCQLAGDFHIVLGLAGQEAGVFEDQDLAGLQGSGGSSRLGADEFFDEGHRFTEQLGELAGGGLHGVLGVGAVFGPAEVREQDQCAVLIEQVFDGGQGAAMRVSSVTLPSLIGTLIVDAHQDLLALEVDIANRFLLNMAILFEYS